MNTADLERVDSRKMFQIYDKWPEIAKESFSNHFDRLDIGDIDHIVFAGMGGSGSIGDVISSILSKEDIHVSNIKGYHLPNTVDSNSLVITTSVSGNTKETLSILKDAHESNGKIAAFSSGGQMKTYCEENNIFFRAISMIHSPRASFLKFLFSILNILKKVIPIDEKEIEDTIKLLYETRDVIFSGKLDEGNISLKLAKWVKEVPLIYYPWGLQSAAIRFKNSLQENSKIHVIAEEVIESSHNGVVAWEKDSKIQPILLRGVNDHIKTIERWDIMEEFFKKQGIDYFPISSIQGSVLSKIVNLIYVLDYSSIYHAILHNVDPSPVSSIDFIKSKM